MKMSEEYSKDYRKGYQEGMLYALSAVENAVVELFEEKKGYISSRFDEDLSKAKGKKARHEAWTKYNYELSGVGMVSTRIKSFATDLKDSILNPVKITPEEEKFLNDRGGVDIPLESLSKDIVYPKCEEEPVLDATDDFDETLLDNVLRGKWDGLE